ncbi:MAG TPA: hypothetical protein PLR78_13055, partial [Polaromonas sp.]|nr:hypothetical protein [Polaromonas sp.]
MGDSSKLGFLADLRRRPYRRRKFSCRQAYMRIRELFDKALYGGDARIQGEASNLEGPSSPAWAAELASPGRRR